MLIRIINFDFVNFDLHTINRHQMSNNVHATDASIEQGFSILFWALSFFSLLSIQLNLELNLSSHTLDRNSDRATEVNALVGKLLEDGTVGLGLQLFGERRSLWQTVEFNLLLLFGGWSSTSVTCVQWLGGETGHVTFDDVFGAKKSS